MLTSRQADAIARAVIRLNSSRARFVVDTKSHGVNAWTVTVRRRWDGRTWEIGSDAEWALARPAIEGRDMPALL